MKKTVSLVLVAAMLTAVFSLCLSFVEYKVNPFGYYDDLRNESIAGAVGTELDGKEAKGEGVNEIGYIVQFKSDVDLELIHACVNEYDFKLLADSEKRLFKICLSAPDEFRAKYADIISSFEAEQVMTLSAEVNDPLAADQWELDFLEAYPTWDITTGHRDITVAVLDSGVYRRHPDFDGVTILAGYDAVDRTNVINVDHNGHGTKVISIIAAASNNGQGMAGLCKDISILPIRVSDYTGYIHSADFIEAVYYAANAGADIINMSFGGYTYSAMEEAAMEYASSKGCLLVSAAGNKENDAQYAGMKAYPASYSSVISVGAIDENGTLCPFSQRNDDVDMVAPGYSITVANVDNSYEKELGTSFAAAYVSAIAALALSAVDEGISFTAEQFVSLVSILNGGKKEVGYGYGAVNALQIVSNINTPLISGVTNGGVYHKNVTVTFNRGTATLDGMPFYSGESVITSGSHTLVVTDGENELIVDFITDNIPLKYEYKTTAGSAFITFNRGSATLDGAPYLSGTAITNEGRHFFILTGPYGNTESFEFVCDFKAPQVFGVENGMVYTTPVYITAEKGGTLTLNGKLITSGTVISKSGAYTLVSASSDGSAKKTYYFTLALGKVSLVNTAVSGSKLIADELFKTLILYNNALSGIRVFSWGNLSHTKCFIRTDSGVTGYGFTKRSLVLLHTEGITVCDRSTIAAGSTDNVVSFDFEKNASASFFKDGYVYYVTSENGLSAIRRMSASDGKTKLLTTVDKTISHLTCNEKGIIVSTDSGELMFFGIDGKLQKHIEGGGEINGIVAADGYICTNNLVYKADTLEKLFALREGEHPIFTKNSVLVTDKAIYDLKKQMVTSLFGDSFTDAVITEGGFVFKSLSASKIEIIDNKEMKFSAITAAEMLNAAECLEVELGEVLDVSAYESYASIPEGIDIIASVLPSKSKVIFALSATKRAIYRISSEKLQVIGQSFLRYEPSALCSDGKYVYVAFKNEKLIYKYSIANNQGDYFSCADVYTALEYSDGKLYALNDKGNLYAISSSDPAAHAETVIKGQNVSSFVCHNGFLYARLKPVTVSLVYKINTSDYTVSESVVTNTADNTLFAANGVIITGNKAYKADTLEPLYTLNENARYAHGKYLITDKGLYLSANGVMLGSCRVDASNPMFADDYGYYNIDANRITRIRNARYDLDSLPTVSGISDGAVLDGPVSVKWSFGEAYLDGEAYTEGTLIENGGLHSFDVSLPFGVSLRIQFTINADINYIVLKAQKNTIKVNESTVLSVNAHPFTYGVVDVVYSTDNDNAVVLPDGSVIGAAVGNCTITATTADGEHKSTVNIRITEGGIEFDSSYFFADSHERIVKGIGAGTDVEAFLIAASQTKGNLVVRGYGEVEVKAGMIHTGMKAELYDIFGKVIDTWQLSVLGDIDGDGFITANDYYSLNKLITHPESFTAAVKASADIDSNGTVNALDLLALKEHLLGQSTIGGIETLPTRVSNAIAHIVMPKKLVADTTFTATLTLTDMKNVSALSGVLSFNSDILTLKEVAVLGKDGGFYTQTDGKVFFFTNFAGNDETAVIVIAVFTVSKHIEPEDTVLISCDGLRVYDGSTAVINSVKADVETDTTANAEVLVHNLPDYGFDENVTDNRLTLPASAQKIYVSAYPMERSDIVGDTSFGNRLNASFSVVFTDSNGGIKQYNYQCEKSEASPPSSGTTEVYKNDNTYLSSVSIIGGTLSPVFDKSISTYYVVTDNPYAVTVEARAESVLTAVAVSEYDEQSGAITIRCTAENGSVGTYTLVLCEKLPISYPNEDKGVNPFLWALPALALIIGAVAFYMYKRGKKDTSFTEENGGV